MTIEKMTSFSELNKGPKYLDSTELVEGNQYERLAFVANASSGVTKRESGYFTFYLKTVDNVILTAQLFNVEKFVESGFTAKVLLHKPVKVKFSAQIYRGRWSLLVSEIEFWEDSFDRSKFLGKLEVNTDIIEHYSLKTGIPVNTAEWADASFAGLADGNSGAFLVVASALLAHMETYQSLWNIDVDQLATVAIYTLKALFRYYCLQETLPVVTKKHLYDELSKVTLAAASSPMEYAIIDSCTEALHMGESTHLYARLVNRCCQDIIKDIRMVYLYKSMPMGGSTYVENKELVKF